VGLVLGLIPLVGASLMWVAPDALGLTDTTADGPTAKRVMFLLLALTALGAAAWAQRRGASWWAGLWGLGAGAVALVLFFVIAVVLLAVAPGETGCPEGRVYC
jgi:hypothetical protein